MTVLDDYAKAIGINALKFCDEVTPILELKSEELRKLDEQTAGIYAFKLAQYSAFLQKEVNRHSSKFKWANHNLNIIVGKVYNNYGDKYTKLDEKKILVINDNEVAQSLNKIILETSLRLEELSFLSTRVNTMSSILVEIQKSKRAERYER